MRAIYADLYLVHRVHLILLLTGTTVKRTSPMWMEFWEDEVLTSPVLSRVLGTSENLRSFSLRRGKKSHGACDGEACCSGTSLARLLDACRVKERTGPGFSASTSGLLCSLRTWDSAGWVGWFPV